MLSPHTSKPKAVMQARNKLQQKAMEPSAEASKVLELHAVSSGQDVVQPLTPCLGLFWLWVVVLPSGDSPNPQ